MEERGVLTFRTRVILVGASYAGWMRGTMTFGLHSKIADFGWPKRLAGYVFLYAAYVLFTIFADPSIVRFIDANYPGVFFYHLQADEAPGPLGDPAILLLSIAIHYIIFIIAFIPIAVKARMSLVLIITFALLNELIIFACQLSWFTLFPID
ncbi:MAG: hypothetical protein EOS36_10090 [Mesorhizobium sp.]|uniref:hypothetical protein n=1 Tax=Mesorhizobium sp. TaxID=1871066 RepID=UPI000FE760E1|nr:hypothetical protein [Mesorhizobium sp.]RWD64388.1 MAG: hypothetical protein EOS36_10090 [Mesorhizobium sp.]RWE39377.1 MAG: hypothetical protein EOS79_21005 [Mesorhizobium sp.]